MRYFWLLDHKSQKILGVTYQPGQENLGDYPSNTTQHKSINTYGHMYYIWISLPWSSTELLCLVLSKGVLESLEIGIIKDTFTSNS